MASRIHKITFPRLQSVTVYHYSDVVMSAMASQITGVSIVCSTACLGAVQRKHQSPASLTFVRESAGDRWIPLTKASCAENVSI